MLTMLVGLAGLSTPLAAQETYGGLLTLGLAYTVGSGWQVQGFDVGYGRALHSGPFAAVLPGERARAIKVQPAIVGGASGVGSFAYLTLPPLAPLPAPFRSDSAA